MLNRLALASPTAAPTAAIALLRRHYRSHCHVGAADLTRHILRSLHHVDAPECDGCCHGRNGTLIQGSPKTGDGWSFTFADGSVATVCKAGSVQGGMAVCDGKANIRPVPPQNRAVALAARALNGIGQPRVILSLR